VNANHELESEARHCGTIEAGARTAARLQREALQSPHDPVWKAGLGNLQTLVPKLSETSLDELNVADAVVNFRLRKTNGLAVQDSKVVGDLIVAAASNSERQKQIALTRLTATKLNSDQPLVARILLDPQIKALNKTVNVAGAKPFETDYLNRVIESSNSSAVALDATVVLENALKQQPADQAGIVIKQLDLQKLEPRFPGTSRQIDRMLRPYLEP
jgi:hypothetical protein